MGSERATIEELEMVHSPMQYRPASVPMDADNLGAGEELGMGNSVPDRVSQNFGSRGPSLIDDREQEDDSDDDGERQRPVFKAPLIEEEDDDDEDEEAVAEAPALDRSGLRQDVDGARDLAEKAGATPGRNWVEAGEILQGDANSARRRGEGRYGAAALHGIADLAVSAGSGEAGEAAAGVVKGALKPLAAPAMVGKLASDAVKYTVGGLVSAGGQAVQKIGDNKRDALDPEGLLEQQRLVDVANRHEYGIDMTSEKQGLTRREEVAARGVRMEQGDKAKKIWNGPKKRSWGRVTQNAIAAPFRGIGKAVKSLVTSPAAGLKSTVNFFSKYGRKAVNGISNIFNRKRRANNALERLRERSAANGADRYPAAPANALKAISPLKQGTYNFRGGEASIRSHTRDVRKAQGFDNILGQKDYEKLSEADRREYKDKEKTLLTESPKYLGANDKVAIESNIIKGIAQKFADPDAQAQGDQSQAPANAPPGNAVAEASNDDFFGKPELAKDSHPGMSIAEGIKEGVGVGEQLVETSKKLDAPVGIVTNFLGQQLPDMLEGQALEDYAPHAESAKAVGDTFKSINENAALYRAPLIGKGLNTGFDLYKTAKQSANRDKDANKTALNERQTLKDTREMSDRVRALLQEKKDAGASKKSIARTSRLRNKMLMLRLVTANRKLAKAQEMNSITPLNEYSKKESDFIGTGNYAKNKEVGAKGVGELGKEAGKATVKTLKAVIGYGGANKADDSKEADRLYAPGGKFQGADAVADQNVIEEIEEEEKHASGELNAGGDSQLGAAAAHQNVIKEVVNRESDELNPMHHSDTNSFSQRQSSYPQQQRPSKVDFNVSDDDNSDVDADVDAVAVGGGGAKIDQPDDAGLDPDLLAQIYQFEGAENGMDGNPQGESIRRIIDFHDSVRSDGTTMERMGSVADDFQEQPMGEQGHQEPALGNGPILKQLIDGQWQMMPEEEKGAVGGPPRPVHGVGAEMLDTSAGGVGRSDMLMDPRELALLRNAADPSRAARQLPAIKETVAKAQGAQTKDDATSGWRQVDKLQQGMVNRRWSQSGLASREGLAAADARQARRDDLLGRAPLIDASTRHEDLDLPEAQVEDRRLEAGGGDQNRLWEFNMPRAKFNIAEHGADDSDEALHRAMQYPEVYLPRIVKNVGRDEAKKKIKYAFERRDPKQRQGIQRMDLDIKKRLISNIDMETKRPLFGDPKANGKFDSLPTDDARAHMGPMTVDDREVVPQFPGGVNPIERQGEERKLYGRHYLEPFGGKWRDKETNQVVQTALTTGDGPRRDVNNPFSAANANDHKEMHFDPIAPAKLLNAPAAGWGNIGKKPWMFAGKKAKEEYKQKTKAIDAVIDDARGKMKGEAMPPFMKGVPYAEKKWREKEREQRELEELAATRRKFGVGSKMLRGL